MAKKKVVSNIVEVAKVFSSKYGCWITQSKAYFDEAINDWLSEDIEQQLKDNKNFGK